MKKERNKDNIRQVNTVMVLDTLRRNNCQMSRPDLADQVGLSKVTIASIIRTLNSHGLTCNAGLGRPDYRGGRKPLLVALDVRNKRVVSLRLSSGGAEMLLSDITGRELSRLKIGEAVDHLAESKPVINPNPYELAAMVRRLSDEGRALPGSIAGLMIAGEGFASPENGSPDHSGNAGPEAEQNLAAPGSTPDWAIELGRLLKVPICLTSLAEARAFGKHWYDEVDNQSDFFYLNLDFDLEAIVFGEGCPGRTLPGFGAACLSHAPFGSENDSVETAQSLLSGAAFLKRAAESLGASISFSDLISRAAKGDEAASHLFKLYGYQLGCILALTVNLCSLQKIVIGGFMTKAWPYFSQTLRLGLDRHLNHIYSGLVDVSPLNDDLGNGLLGAQALALDKWIYHTSLLPKY